MENDREKLIYMQRLVSIYGSAIRSQCYDDYGYLRVVVDDAEIDLMEAIEKLIKHERLGEG